VLEDLPGRLARHAFETPTSEGGDATRPSRSTCDNFLTTGEFLPLHRDQLARTEQLITAARENGNARLVEMNEPVRLNLLAIIEGLQTLDAGGVRDAC
jgi:hypothetical protein